MVSLPNIPRLIPEPCKKFSISSTKFPKLKTNKKQEEISGIKLNVNPRLVLNGVKNEKVNGKKCTPVIVSNGKIENNSKVELKINDLNEPLKLQPLAFNRSSTLNSIIRNISNKIELKPHSEISKVSFNDETVPDDLNRTMSIIDSLKFKYLNNPTFERRETISKLNRFKKKCSIAIAKTTESVETFEAIRKNKKASVTFESADNDYHKPVDNGPHFGSCLSFDGQFATLSGIEDLVRGKLKAKLDEFLTESTPRTLKFKRYKNDKKQELINELKEIIAVNTVVNNVPPQQQKNENNGYQNPFRKALISKYIQDGLMLLDEINKFLKTNFLKTIEDENFNSDSKIQESLYSFENYSSSNSKSDDFNFIDPNLRRTQELTNKFSDWKRIWLTAF